MPGIILKIGSGRNSKLTEPPIINGWSIRLVIAVIFFLFPSMIEAAELQTRYATIHYEHANQLQKLNRELVPSKNLVYLLQRHKIMTVNDEVAAKIDIIIEQVQIVLEMFPEKLRFEIMLYSTAAEAQEALFKRYRKKVNYISFYSRRENILYLSAQHGKLGVVAHELGHVVIEHYFNRSPPVKIHELMAQYAERHITD
ncbi:MAG: hypothetical protein KKB30_03990 [Proteobacteria bacterium]|nr:hypothetical protein [Pseudomonadota bacterium]MBU1717267.1 hypothetical protein [Pseudomonadota bacterium]